MLHPKSRQNFIKIFWKKLRNPLSQALEDWNHAQNHIYSPKIYQNPRITRFISHYERESFLFKARDLLKTAVSFLPSYLPSVCLSVRHVYLKATSCNCSDRSFVLSCVIFIVCLFASKKYCYSYSYSLKYYTFCKGKKNPKLYSETKCQIFLDIVSGRDIFIFSYLCFWATYFHKWSINDLQWSFNTTA